MGAMIGYIRRIFRLALILHSRRRSRSHCSVVNTTAIFLGIRMVYDLVMLSRNVSKGRIETGVESQAVIEFAPYQKIPPEKKKIDGRNGTIEKGM